MADITAVILTKNEEKNIRECIESVKSIVKRFIIVDGYSTDNTCEIAKEYGAEIYEFKHISYAADFTYGVKQAGNRTKWIFRLDADERLTSKGVEELDRLCRENENTDINGIIIRYKKFFLGKSLNYGAAAIKKLAVFKSGMGEIEDKLADEHIFIYSGRTYEMKNEALHYDFKNLSCWIERHNIYSTREMEDFYSKRTIVDSKKGQFSKADRRLTRLKAIYYKFPAGLRCRLYYWYRYYVKLGFLDGKEGKIYAFLQAYWYRYLVDAKIYERNKANSHIN